MNPEQWSRMRAALAAKAATQAAAAAAARAAMSQVDAAEMAVVHHTDAHTVALDVGRELQAAAHSRIAAVVTRCLSHVFGPGAYGFELLFEEKAGRTTARCVFARDGHHHDPLAAAGGGPVDVAAFGLRLAALALHRPRLRPVVVLDEPFKFVNHRYQPALVSLLTGLAEEMGFQIIMITHIPGLVCGDVHELGD